MRLDFDFQGGGGFVVARKLFPLTLPESYAFSFDIRGRGPSNILEFKLVDASNQNVWRWRVEAFDLPGDWQTLRIKSSEIQFAWGPLGGGPARDIAAIELVIAAGPGGQGTVWIEGLRVEDTSYYLTPLVEATSALRGCEALPCLGPLPRERLAQRGHGRASTAGHRFPVRARIWRPGDPLGSGAAAPSLRGPTLPRWGRLANLLFGRGGGGRGDLCLPTPGQHRASSRSTCTETRQGEGFGIVHVEVQPYDFSRSINDFFSAIAQRTRAGLYPKYLLGRQTYWTPVGTGEDVTQALFNEEGMVEVDKGAFSIEPFLFVDGRLITWADVSPTQTLEQGYLPIPSSHWRAGDLTLADHRLRDRALRGLHPLHSLSARERLGRGAPGPLVRRHPPLPGDADLAALARFGGVSQIGELVYESGTVWVDGRKRVIPMTAPSQFGAATFAQGCDHGAPANG